MESKPKSSASKDRKTKEVKHDGKAIHMTETKHPSGTTTHKTESKSSSGNFHKIEIKKSSKEKDTKKKDDKKKDDKKKDDKKKDDKKKEQKENANIKLEISSPKATTQLTQVGKKDSSTSPPEGYCYNENNELIPVFLKKLAINKNEQIHKKEDDEKLTDSNEKLDSVESEESDQNIPSGFKDIKDVLQRNREWVEETIKNNPDFLKEISAPQHPKFLIISCSDSRIQTSRILCQHPGELFVHRNIGNIVLAADFNFQSVLSYAVENLKVKNIIVLGHTDCGAVKTSLSNKYHGLIDHWLKPIKDVVERQHDYLDKIMKECPEKLTTVLSELNIKEQVINLCKNPIVQKAWNEGQELYIHGLIFDMDTGFVRDLGIMKKEWKQIKNIHALEFEHKL